MSTSGTPPSDTAAHDGLTLFEQQAAALYFVYGATSSEIGTLLGVGEHDVALTLTLVAAKSDRMVAHAAANRACPERRFALRAHVLGPAGAPLGDLDGIEEHVAACAACSAQARRIRYYAALIPPDALPWKALGLDLASLLQRAVTRPASAMPRRFPRRL